LTALSLLESESYLRESIYELVIIP